MTGIETSGSVPTGAAAPTVVLAEYTDYAGAQALVDRLSDAKFPVEHLRIVGTGLRSVEQVTGRLTIGRAALYGAGSGAWFGLLIGLLFSLFTVGASWLIVILVSVLIGAFWGALFGLIAHAATGGRRDFSSIRGTEAERYAVTVRADQADAARRLIGA